MALLMCCSKSPGPLPPGVLEMRKGGNSVYLALVGSDPRSKGLGLGLLELVFEKAN
jgi:hypothetical protein